MIGPYHVEIDNDGCRFCGAGKTYWVVGQDDSADSQSFENEDDAEDLCDKLNEAYEQGRKDEYKTTEELVMVGPEDNPRDDEPADKEEYEKCESDRLAALEELAEYDRELGIRDGETVCQHLNRPFECKLCRIAFK